MTDNKEKLERLRQVRTGHRGDVTRKLKEAEQILNVLQDVAEIPEKEGSCLSVIRHLLERKQKILHRYNEDILNVCNVENIAKGIEDSDEIISKIVECLTKMTEKMCIKPQSVEDMDDVIAVGASASSTSQIQPTEIQKPDLPKLQMEKFKGDVTIYKAFTVLKQRSIKTRKYQCRTSLNTFSPCLRDPHYGSYKAFP